MAFWRRRKRIEKKISLLVPFKTDGAEREANWQWLKCFWESAMPDAEVIVESDDGIPFCKTAAVNRAFARSRGDIIVILDADCFINPEAIRECADRIREAIDRNQALWYLPYRRFYRLTEEATAWLLGLDPEVMGFFEFVDPPEHMYHNAPTISGSHWWGALIQVMPREAFIAAGKMDERFKGWGGEDASFMHALDTLYGQHRTLDAPVFHLWHPTIPGVWKGTRQWFGQMRPEINDQLAGKYIDALGDRLRMSKLVHRQH
jgi:predicted glycosyltransferase involved in capsule biosynthesis